jgi:hypothetical protein
MDFPPPMGGRYMNLDNLCKLLKLFGRTFLSSNIHLCGHQPRSERFCTCKRASHGPPTPRLRRFPAPAPNNITFLHTNKHTPPHHHYRASNTSESTARPRPRCNRQPAPESPRTSSGERGTSRKPWYRPSTRARRSRRRSKRTRTAR